MKVLVLVEMLCCRKLLANKRWYNEHLGRNRMSLNKKPKTNLGLTFKPNINFKDKTFQKFYSPIQSNQVQKGWKEPGTPNCSPFCLSITGAFMALAVGVLGKGSYFLCFLLLLQSQRMLLSTLILVAASSTGAGSGMNIFQQKGGGGRMGRCPLAQASLRWRVAEMI